MDSDEATDANNEVVTSTIGGSGEIVASTIGGSGEIVTSNFANSNVVTSNDIVISNIKEDISYRVQEGILNSSGTTTPEKLSSVVNMHLDTMSQNFMGQYCSRR